MKKLISRSVALILAVVLCLGFVPASYAANDVAEVELSLTSWLTATFEIPTNIAANLVKDLAADGMFGGYLGPLDNANELEAAAEAYRHGFKQHIYQLVDQGIVKTYLQEAFNGRTVAEPAYDDQTGYYRLRNRTTGDWLVNSEGKYPYCTKEAYEGTPGHAPAQGISTGANGVQTSNKWVPNNLVSGSLNIVDYSTLSDACVSLNAQGDTCVMKKVSINGVAFWVIQSSTKYTSQANFYWGDVMNRIYAANVADESPSVTNNQFNYNTVNKVDNSDHSVNTDNSVKIDAQDTKIIDLTNGVLNMITENGDKFITNIDDVIYNFDDHSYTVNTHNYTYNTDSRSYTYNYYTYNIQYTYNNTYITYIGSTAEYQPSEYELYYELPDGRSSADLTEEDIAGLAGFEFYDCINYKKAATDLSLRALYHFDGNMEDDSYFSTQSAFEWKSGASITYMESNAFNGALYLDEKPHEFTITLPSNLSAGDWTIQWRYYQNSSELNNDNNDNYLMLEDRKVLGWGEQSFYWGKYDANGRLTWTKISNASVAIGSWQELALVHHNDVMYLYQNGLCLGSWADSRGYDNTFTFHLGDISRAYSMFDELRVVRFPVAENGASYTCTAVPYDTNSVLVLPDGAHGIADEGWNFPTEKNLLSFYDFTAVTNKDVSYQYKGDHCWYNQAYTVCKFYDGYFSMGNTTMLYYTVQSSGLKSAFEVGKDYTFSIYTLEGNCYSLPIHLDKISLKKQIRAEFDWGYLLYIYPSSQGSSSISRNYYENLRVSVNSGHTLNIVYAELIEGTEPSPVPERVSAVYSSDELKPNTAAIQSDIPIHGYTVGGVRPTFPVRGDVWMPVEGSRIAGVYIYNGQAWETTNARWYTGKRWIPIYAFDLVTLADMWDVASSTGEDVSPPITSDYGFWQWWKSQWLDFRAWLSNTWVPGTGPGSGDPGGSGGGGGSGSSLWETIGNAVADGLGTLIKVVMDFITEVLKTVLDLLLELLQFFTGFLGETVIAGIGGLFSGLTDGSLLSPFQTPGEDGTVTYQLPEGVAVVFAFFSGVILALPVELRSVLIFGVAALVLIAVFKMAKS